MSVEEELKALRIEHEELHQKYRDVLELALNYQDENKELKNKVKKLKEEIKKLSSHNIRGAGRHKKDFTEDIEKIKSYRNEGKTVKEIAKLLKCSERRIYRLLSV